MKKLMYIAAALLVLVGCNKKENVIENTPQNLVTITGGIDFSAQDGPNKVVAKEGWENVTSGNQVEFMWEEGDKIAVLTTDGTEIKQFTVSEILQDGKSATFAGEPLSGGMESYYVIYPYELGVAAMQQGGRDAFFANQQYTGKLRPAVQGVGTNDSFTLDGFFSVIDLSLTGSVKLGKIVYHVDNDGKGNPYDATLSFGEGLQLTNEPQHVTFTPCYLYAQGFTLSFYDTDNQLIMEKKSEKNIASVGGIISFPTLEVKAAAQSVDWTIALGESFKWDAQSIVIETGVVDVSSYTVDDTHQKLNDDGTLWAYLDGDNKLHIQTPASMINSNLEGMFSEAHVESISGLQYIHATTAKLMFSNCTFLQTIDFTGFNTANVTDMQNMFNSCSQLTNIDLSGFNTANVTDMSYMFSWCNALTSLDLSGFNTANVTNMSSMFYNCRGLESLTLSDDFKVASIKPVMFSNCGQSVAGGGTIYGASESFKAALTGNIGNMHFAEY